MKHYQGRTNEDLITGGGRYVTDNQVGHEVCNFAHVDGTLYGYVQVGKVRNGKYEIGEINFPRLGMSIEEDVIEGGTVIWTATDPEKGGRKIVGWYRNASIFRTYQHFENIPPSRSGDGLSGYWVSAPAEDCVLLPEDKRTFLVPSMKKGFPGRSPIWYADSQQAVKFLRQAHSFISSYLDSDSALDDLEPDSLGNADPGRIESKQYRFKRDANVRNAVLRRANGHCEYCREQGFALANGGHYLEAHHIICSSRDLI